MTDLTEQIWAECDRMGLLYDKVHLPIKVGPDCYIIYATTCEAHGDCRRRRYYALTGGSSIKIYEN